MTHCLKYVLVFFISVFFYVDHMLVNVENRGSMEVYSRQKRIRGGMEIYKFLSNYGSITAAEQLSNS